MSYRFPSSADWHYARLAWLRRNVTACSNLMLILIKKRLTLLYALASQSDPPTTQLRVMRQSMLFSGEVTSALCQRSIDSRL